MALRLVAFKGTPIGPRLPQGSLHHAYPNPAGVINHSVDLFGLIKPVLHLLHPWQPLQGRLAHVISGHHKNSPSFIHGRGLLSYEDQAETDDQHHDEGLPHSERSPKHLSLHQGDGSRLTSLEAGSLFRIISPARSTTSSLKSIRWVSLVATGPGKASKSRSGTGTARASTDRP